MSEIFPMIKGYCPAIYIREYRRMSILESVAQKEYAKKLRLFVAKSHEHIQRALIERTPEIALRLQASVCPLPEPTVFLMQVLAATESLGCKIRLHVRVEGKINTKGMEEHRRTIEECNYWLNVYGHENLKKLGDTECGVDWEESEVYGN
jgi:hypothetical protein